MPPSSPAPPFFPPYDTMSRLVFWFRLGIPPKMSRTHLSGQKGLLQPQNQNFVFFNFVPLYFSPPTGPPPLNSSPMCPSENWPGSISFPCGRLLLGRTTFPKFASPQFPPSRSCLWRYTNFFLDHSAPGASSHFCAFLSRLCYTHSVPPHEVPPPLFSPLFASHFVRTRYRTKEFPCVLIPPGGFPLPIPPRCETSIWFLRPK